MPRSARIDVATTRLLLANGLLLDPRSFVGHGIDMVPHLYLKGPDMSRQRDTVIHRDGGRCRVCKAWLSGENGEAHHVLPRGKGGSDDIDDLEWRCGPETRRTCHTAMHVQLRSAKIQAAEEFEALYPKKYPKEESK